MKKLTVHRALKKITMPHKIMKPTVSIEEETIEVNEAILEDVIETPKEEEVVTTTKKQSGKNKKNNTNDKASEEENKESNKKEEQ